MSNIRNLKNLTQPKSFDGMNFIRGIKPTDIDGYFEISNKLFIFFELKYKDSPMTNAQKAGFERLCDVFDETKNKEAIFIIAKHDVPSTDDSRDCIIDVSKCEVVRYRRNKKWTPNNKVETLKDFIDRYLKHQKIR